MYAQDHLILLFLLKVQNSRSFFTHIELFAISTLSRGFNIEVIIMHCILYFVIIHTLNRIISYRIHHQYVFVQTFQFTNCKY